MLEGLICRPNKNSVKIDFILEHVLIFGGLHLYRLVFLLVILLFLPV